MQVVRYLQSTGSDSIAFGQGIKYYRAPSLLNSLIDKEAPNNRIQNRSENGGQLLENLKLSLPFSGGGY